jgi:hypothetical protein
MKKKLLFFLAQILTLAVFAQVPPYYNFVPVGGANSFPFNINAATGKKVQWILLAGDLATPAPAPSGNNITSLWVYKSAGTANTVTYTTLTIKFASVPANTYFATGAYYPGVMTTALAQTTALTIPAAAGWVEIPLTTPYLYDPSQGLVVEISQCAYIGTGFSVPQNSLGASPNFRRQYSDASSPCGITPLVSGGDLNVAGLGVSLTPASPCVAPPTPGTSTATPATVCVGANLLLSLTGNSQGTGQTYQWESSPNVGGPYTVLSGLLPSPSYNTPATSNLYYRCAVTCSGNTQYSTPVLVTTVNGISGTYTINSALPTGGSNFQNFAAMVSALACGLTGPVVVNVVPGSGPYTEQVAITQLLGASAINTLTINGNGETLTFSATLASDPHTMVLNGADFIKINNLNFVATGATYAFPLHLWNNANNNKFTNCTFTCPQNLTGTVQSPFSISGSATSAITAGPSGSNDTIVGCTMNNGYYGATFAGNSGGVNTGNVMSDCNIKDFHFYGIYNSYNNGLMISNNIIERPTRTNLTTFYGIFVTTGCVGISVFNNRVRHPFAMLPTSASLAYAIYSTIDGTLGNENRYYNNVISNMNSWGTQAGFYLSGVDYVKVYHNTISLDDAAATAGLTYGIYNTGTVGGIEIKNNIISITRGGSGTKYCLYYSNASTISNKNVLYINSPLGLNYVGFYLAAQATLANWQAVNGNVWDQQSVAANPLFNNPLANDYTPTELLCNNIGDPVGILNDITGFVRSLVTPDPGAYEYANAAIDLSVTALPVPNNSGCYDANQTVSITILNAGASAVDFSINPAAVSCVITGALNTTLNATINSGTLAANTSMVFSFPTTINMAINGAYTFSPSVSVVGDGNPANNTLTPAVTRTAGIVGGVLTTSMANICLTGTPVLTVTGSTGGSRQWRESSISPTGPWTNVGAGLTSYTPAVPITQTTYYQVLMTCNGNSDSSNTVTVTVNNPQITSTTPDTVCAGNAAVLAATANVGNTIDWFDVPTGGTSLFTGPSYTTPVLNNTTTYYAEASAGGGGANVSVPMLPQGSNFTGNVRGYWFTAPVSFTLTGVEALGTTVGPQSIAVIKFNPAVAPPAYPTVTNAFSTLYLTQNNPTVGVIPVNIQINAGDVIGLFGQKNNVTSYATPTGPYTTTIGGQPVTFTRMGMQFNLQVQAPIDVWQEAAAATGRVQMTYSLGCSGTRVPVVALVDPIPAITAIPAASTVCMGSMVTLSGSGAGVGGTYSWTGGITDGVPFVANATTTYTVTGTTANGCTSTAIAVVTVNPFNTGSGSATPGTICLGDNTVINASATPICAGNVNDFAGIYAPGNWAFSVVNSNGTVNTAGAPANIIISSGNNNSGTPGTTNYTIPMTCSGNVTFNWSYANIDVFGSIFDYPRYTINGGAPVVFTSFVIGGSNSQSGVQTIAVNPGDVLQLQMYTIDNDVNPGFVTISTFSAPATAINGSVTIWDAPSGGNNLGAPPVTVTPAAAGVANYYIEITSNPPVVCVNPVRVAIPVIVNSFTNLLANASPATICTGGSSLLSSNAISNLWNPGALVGSPTVSPVTTTTYSLTGTDANGCTATTTIEIVVNGSPVVSASASPSTICEGSSSVLTGGGAATYAWDPGALVGSPTVSPIVTTTYSVTGTDANGCTGTATVEVTVNPAPAITATATPTTTCTQTVVTPSASGAATIAWSGGVTNNIPFIANATTTYTVTGTDGIGCTGSTTVLVTVNPMSGILAPASSNQSQDHGDDFNVNYYDASCDLIATVDDGAGGNILGLTTSTVTVDPGFGVHNGQPFVRRWYQITPTNNGSADVVLYINQSDFDNYNLGVALPYFTFTN